LFWHDFRSPRRNNAANSGKLSLMQVRVLFFGMLKEMVGKSADLIDLPDGASVRDLLARYEVQNPRLKESLPSLALAVNQQYAGPDTKLSADDEVALLPPVSGGAPEAAGGTPTRQPAGRRRYQRITWEQPPSAVRRTNAPQFFA
jgi:molybdopterin converting factor subunit 1